MGNGVSSSLSSEQKLFIASIMKEKYEGLKDKVSDIELFNIMSQGYIEGTQQLHEISDPISTSPATNVEVSDFNVENASVTFKNINSPLNCCSPEKNERKIIVFSTGKTKVVSLPYNDEVSSSIDTDFHPERALVRAKTSSELLKTSNNNLLEQSERVSGFISQLKNGDVATKKSSEFRTRRLTYSQRTAQETEPVTPIKSRATRTTIFSSSEIGVRQEKVPPFDPLTMGTFSCHGIEPDGDSEDGKVHDKVNQDRACIVYPFCPYRQDEEALFIVLDGHGEQGDRISEFVMRQIVISLEKDELISSDPPQALKDTFVKTNTALMCTGMNYMTSGCTCVAVYINGTKIYVANCGDSRAVMGVSEKDRVVARNLTVDHKPDTPEEERRILDWGGFVSVPDEIGLSSRVYLDADLTMIGLAMSRSIGDYAVKAVGVIPLPDVTEYELDPQDQFMIIATDGVWEFISSQEAVDIVSGLLEDGANYACRELIQLAKERWHEEEGDYRDDITAIVLKFPLPFQSFICY